MSEIKEGFKLGNAVMELVSKVLGPSLTRRQALANAQTELHGALARQLTAHIESFPGDPDVLEAIISCGGKMNLVNLAKIVQMAASQLNEAARPSRILDDWAANFREKSRTCSDEEMAMLWASLLAGEATSPGSISRKTVNIMADLEPCDARLFRTVANFRITWLAGNLTVQNESVVDLSETIPTTSELVVLDATDPIYVEHGITRDSLERLSWLGLIEAEDLSTRFQGWKSKTDDHWAFEHSEGRLHLHADESNQLGFPIGRARFTPAGVQLAQFCTPLENPKGFIEYLTEEWEKNGIDVQNFPLLATSDQGSQDIHG